MGLARIALLSCLLLSISYNNVDAEILCEVLTQQTENFTCCAVVNDIICHVNQGNISYGSEYYDRTMICNNSTIELDLICEDTEMMLLEVTNTTYDCNCTGLVYPLISNITCTPRSAVMNAEILCEVLDPEISDSTCATVTYNISCEVNQTATTYQPENSITVCNSSTNGLDIIRNNTEKALLEDTNTTYDCNGAGLMFPLISNITCTPRPAVTTSPNFMLTTTTTVDTKPVPTPSPHTTVVSTTDPPTTMPIPTEVSTTDPPTIMPTMATDPHTTDSEESTTDPLAAMPTTDPPAATMFNTNPSTIEMLTSAAMAAESLDLTTLVLWIVLGCLIVLIIITIGAIFLVSVAYCQRYKSELFLCIS